jgi:hypothetical protein
MLFLAQANLPVHPLQYKNVLKHQLTFQLHISTHFYLYVNFFIVLGGLLSAHLLYKKTGMELEPGWPCSGPLLRLAETVKPVHAPLLSSHLYKKVIFVLCCPKRFHMN